MIERKFIVVDVTHTLISKRQHQVLKLANDGLARKDIARRLGIGEESIKEHLQRVYRKLGASSAGQACAIARSVGLL